MNTGIIYMYTSPNGKKYIGQTWHEQKRKWDHKSAKRNSLFHKAIKKYGVDSFVYEILHSGIESQDKLNNLEISAIKKFNTTAPYGYNLTTGGEGGKHNEITKQKMRDDWEKNRDYRIEKFKKAAERPEVKNRLKNNAINNAKNKDIAMKKSKSLKEAFSSNEVRISRSEKRKEEWKNPEIRKKRLIGMIKSQSSEVSKKTKKEIMIKRWQNQDYRIHMSNKLKGKKRSQRAIESSRLHRIIGVICVEINKKFNSIKEASEFFNISHSCISCALSGKQKTAAGYTWKRAKDD